MYTFTQKKTISRKIADQSCIDRYRQLLRSIRHPAAGRKMTDRQRLAESLCYELLGKYSERELAELVRTSGQTEPAGTGTPARTKAADVKKNFRNSSSTRASGGPIWTTLLFGLRTAYIQTALICGTISGSLKGVWTEWRRLTVHCLRTWSLRP